MKTLLHKATVLLLLGGYLLAVTVGGAFHTHGGHTGCPASGALPGHEGDSPSSHAVLVSNGCGVSAPDGAERLEAPSTTGPGIDDPHCSVCAFLAQTPIPAAPVAGPALAGAVCLAVPIHRVAPVDEIPATLWGRGPPSLA